MQNIATFPRSALRGENPLVDLSRRLIEAAEDDPVYAAGFEILADGTDGDLRCLFSREAIDSSGDCRKSDRLYLVLAGELHRAAVTASEEIGLAMGAAAPDRPDGVEDPPCGEIEAGRGLGGAGCAAMQLFAGEEQFLARCPVNGAIDAAPAEQGSIGSVDDCVDG